MNILRLRSLQRVTCVALGMAIAGCGTDYTDLTSSELEDWDSNSSELEPFADETSERESSESASLEFADDGSESQQLGVLTQALKRSSGCDGQYQYKAVRDNGSTSGFTSRLGYFRNFKGKWHLRRSAKAGLPSQARKKARRSASDAVVACGHAHYDARWSGQSPNQCKDRVTDYPFEDFKDAFRKEVQSQLCAKDPIVTDKYRLKIRILPSGKSGCHDPNTLVMTSTYGVRCN